MVQKNKWLRKTGGELSSLDDFSHAESEEVLIPVS